jgi:small conductance mechanosensitive channel
MEIGEQWTNAANVVVALVTTYGLRIVGAIIILVLGWVTARLLFTAIERLCLKSSRIDQTIMIFLANGARYSVLVFTFVAVLTTFGIATTSFVAVLGALGIAIGLALQGTLSNLAAGIMLILFRPFHIGDEIEAGGVVGTTRVINLFYTEIDNGDNVRVVIPNGKLWGEIVRIHSRNSRRLLNLHFQRPANDDIGTAINRVRELAQRDRRISEVAAIGVENVNVDGYVLTAQVWVDRRELGNVQFDLNRAVLEALEWRELVIVERHAAAR